MKLIINETQLNRINESADEKISCIINYIKSFGQKGKLPSVNRPLSDWYNDALQTAYEWASKSTDGIVTNGFAYFKHQFKNYIENSFTISKRGLIYVERSIDVDASNGLDKLNFKSIGECWSWKKHNSQSYCANFSLLNNKVTSVILCGYVHPDSIDWVETVYLNSYKMKNETEIRMNDNALVEVSYIKIHGRKYSLNGSYLLNASSDKYNKNRDMW